MLMRTFFVLVSGEHPTIPYAEVNAALEVLGYNYKVIEVLPQIIRLKAERDPCAFLADRCSMVHLCCTELFSCRTSLKDVLTNLSKVIPSFLRGRKIAVRVRRVGERRVNGLRSVELERILGENVVRALGAKVDLESPEVTLIGVVSDKFLFGILCEKGRRGEYESRRARCKPFFHPSSFDPRLARALVNLARTRRGDLVLDPFFGTGGILIEAGLIGGEVIGVDIDEDMAHGGLVNLRHYGVEPVGVIVADSLLPPFRRGFAKRIITDPPYGRTASTHQRTPSEIISRLPQLMNYLLKDDGWGVMIRPLGPDVVQTGAPTGLNVLERHTIRVHSGLTREVLVVKKGDGGHILRKRGRHAH